MTTVRITQPAPDGEGTSIVVNGVEMREHILAGGVTVQRIGPSLPALVTLTIVADELDVDLAAADVVVVGADRPLTGDELATIEARAEALDDPARPLTPLQEYVTAARDVPRLVAEVKRLRAAPEPVCTCSRVES
jgi:hypothetical protein